MNQSKVYPGGEEQWESADVWFLLLWLMQKTMGCILHSPPLPLPGLFIDVFLFLMSPCLPLWHRFKVSHIIRESRASLLRLWGFPSRLYNDLPVGLFWFWLHSLLANSAQLWPGSSPNRTHFVLDSVFGTSCSCTTPAADSFVLLTAGFFFLHHPLLLLPPKFDLFFRPRCPLFPSLCFSLSLFLSHFYWHFFQLSPQALSPLRCLQKRLLVLWCMRAADAHLLPSSQSGGFLTQPLATGFSLSSADESIPTVTPVAAPGRHRPRLLQ